MRRVKPGKIPAVLDGPTSAGGKEIAAAITFYADTANAQKELPGGGFKAYSHPTVKAAINEVFMFKCAYCESFFGAVHPVDVEHFRPKAAVDVNGAKRKPGYYWLAADWSNMLASCIFCNRENRQVMPDGTSRVTGKGNNFPIEKESDRGTKPGGEKKEKRLLLNPYLDRPDSHLTFDAEGLVRPHRTARGKESAMGAKSIEVYGLLRRELLSARADVAKDVDARMKRIRKLWLAQQQTPNPLLLETIQEEIAELKGRMEPDQPYSAMVNQLVKPFLKAFTP